MGAFRDLTGQKFGRLTIIETTGKNKAGQYRWRASCVCGKDIIALGSNIIRGDTQSCGCLQKERAAQAHFKHGGSSCKGHTKEYATWSRIKNRCCNPKSLDYLDYGGRGIKICDRWLDPEHGFENFLADMGPCPSPKHSIERKDNDGDYCPENCVWATQKEQQNNRRNNHKIEFRGETKTLMQWSEEKGINRGTLRTRIEDLGWPIEKALNTPARKHK